MVDSTFIRINYDYNINIEDEENDVVVLSIHGGLIEPYTSEVLADIANRFTWKRYDFSGHATEFCGKYFAENCPKLNNGETIEKVRRNNFNNLHVTSTRFNKPDAIKLVESNPKSVSIHGYNPKREYDKGTICVVGRKIEKNTQVEDFIDYIEQNKGGLKIKAIDARGLKDGQICGLEGETFGSLGGTLKSNIVNLNSSKAGLQLEFNYEMIESLGNRSSPDYDEYAEYREVIYDAIEYAVSEFDG